MMLLDVLADIWRFRSWLLRQPPGSEVGYTWQPQFSPLGKWIEDEIGVALEFWWDSFNEKGEDDEDGEIIDGEEGPSYYSPLWVVIYHPIVDGRKDHYFTPITCEWALEALIKAERIAAQRLLREGIKRDQTRWC